MRSLKKDLQLDDISFFNDRRAIRDIFVSYDLKHLCGKVDEYIAAALTQDLPKEMIQTIAEEGRYFVLERPLDAAIAKVVESPFLVRYFPPLYEYLIQKTRPYKEATPDFFKHIRLLSSSSRLDIRYIDIEKIDFFDTFDENDRLQDPSFSSLLRRTATKCFEKLLVVRPSAGSDRYVCIKNSHLLYAHKVLVHLDDYRDQLDPALYQELKDTEGLDYLRKIRVDLGYHHEMTEQLVEVGALSFWTMVDVFYHYVYERPDIFSQLTHNIMVRGFNPVDVNGYLFKDQTLLPYTGVYPLLALKAIAAPEVVGRAFFDIQAMIESCGSPHPIEQLSLVYQVVEEEGLCADRVKVAGVLAYEAEKIRDLDVASVDIDEDQEEKEEAEELVTVPLREPVTAAERVVESEAPGRRSVIEAIGLPLVPSDVINRQKDGLIRYGKTILRLAEIEAIDHRAVLSQGLTPRFKSDLMDFLSMKKDFPILRATPLEDGWYQINPLDHKYLLMRMIQLNPRLVKDIDEQFYRDLVTAKRYYDVKRNLRAEVKVQTSEKSKKGNIFHNLGDGKLNRELLKKDKAKDSLSPSEMVELSVILDKDCLARFNPVKDPVIFYRTVRSFLECLLHLYYLHLEESNIYHDDGKWTDKFKPLSAWVSMYNYIYERRTAISGEVFPPEIWKAVKDSLRMDTIFILNEITHMSSSTSSYAEECRDFIWQSASLEEVVVYMLDNFR